MATKGIVVYDTSYGNTRKIAEVLAGSLREKGHEVDLFYVKELAPSQYDFLILGSPTRMNTMSFTMKSFIKNKFKEKGWMDKPFATFDTEGVDVIERNGPSAAEKMKDLLIQRGLKPLLPVLKTGVLGIKGPLKEVEVERTQKYADELNEKLKER